MAVPYDSDFAQTRQNLQLSRADQQTIRTFQKNVNSYVKLRRRVKAKLPKLSKDSTPEQIEKYRSSLEDALRAARTNARPGDIFTLQAADYIRRVLKNEFKGQEKKEIREIALAPEGAPVRVPLKINYTYPDKNEFTEMPASVLLVLPQLPREVQYRFVRRSLVLLDRESNIIVDFITDALP